VISVGSIWKSWKYLKSGFVDEIHNDGTIDELTLLRLTTSAALGACYIAADKLNFTTVNKTYKENTEEFYHYKRDNMPTPIDPENMSCGESKNCFVPIERKNGVNSCQTADCDNP
jgi:hypothetical protein